jgi:hypothetical protein
VRWVLIIYLFMASGTAQIVQPIEIPQSTDISCGKAAEKAKADIMTQQPQVRVVVLCIDKGSSY